MLEFLDLAKAALILIGALAYFVLPVDLLPDMVPVVGRFDDLVILLSAIPSAVKLYYKLTEKKETKP